MRVCIAQIKPSKGDIQANKKKHIELIKLAATYSADIIVFPELSLTGYEPKLSKKLAITEADAGLNEFQELCDARGITIGVGVPTVNQTGICISMILFQPLKTRQTYSKKYIHADEEPYFVSGENLTGFNLKGVQISFAICYELSVHKHLEEALEDNPGIYIASVAKSATGVVEASDRLSEIAKQYNMVVGMSNCTGPCEGFESAGQSSIWNEEGILIGQLNNHEEGILMLDTDSKETIKETIWDRWK